MPTCCLDFPNIQLVFLVELLAVSPAVFVSDPDKPCRATSGSRRVLGHGCRFQLAPLHLQLIHAGIVQIETVYPDQTEFHAGT